MGDEGASPVMRSPRERATYSIIVVLLVISTILELAIILVLGGAAFFLNGFPSLALLILYSCLVFLAFTTRAISGLSLLFYWIKYRRGDRSYLAAGVLHIITIVLLIILMAQLIAAGAVGHAFDLVLFVLLIDVSLVLILICFDWLSFSATVLPIADRTIIKGVMRHGYLIILIILFVVSTPFFLMLPYFGFGLNEAQSDTFEEFVFGPLSAYSALLWFSPLLIFLGINFILMACWKLSSLFHALVRVQGQTLRDIPLIDQTISKLSNHPKLAQGWFDLRGWISRIRSSDAGEPPSAPKPDRYRWTRWTSCALILLGFSFLPVCGMAYAEYNYWKFEGVISFSILTALSIPIPIFSLLSFGEIKKKRIRNILATVLMGIFSLTFFILTTLSLLSTCDFWKFSIWEGNRLWWLLLMLLFYVIASYLFSSRIDESSCSTIIGLCIYLVLSVFPSFFYLLAVGFRWSETFDGDLGLPRFALLLIVTILFYLVMVIVTSLLVPFLLIGVNRALVRRRSIDMAYLR